MESGASSTERKKLPHLPDFILEQMGGAEFVDFAHGVGFLGPNDWIAKQGKHHRVADCGTKTPRQAFIPAELKKKIVQGDYKALAEARKKNLQDLQPNFTTIQNASNAKHAYATVTNPSNGRKYQICASDSGWVWHYTVDISHTPSAKGNDDTVTQCVVQSGTYSKSGQFLGISYQTFTNIPTAVSDFACSAMAAIFTFNFLKQYLINTIFETALSSALESAASEVVAAGLMISSAATSMAAVILAGLAAGIIGVVLAFAFFYLVDFLHRSYGLTISIYNWDSKSAWDVTSWYGDNAVVSQETAADGGWKQASLLPVQNSVPGPFGPIPSDQPVAQYASYSYKNNNEWLEGLAVAMKVVSTDASFYFKYDLRRFANNLIGYQGNTRGSISDFYNDDSTWRPSGDYFYTGKVDGRPDLTVTLITTALNGERAYNLEVHIGVEQSH